MSKLYVFAIGGTGSRILRSFTYLLASGVSLKHYDEVVPLIIDPDFKCGNTTDTISLLAEYKEIHKNSYSKEIKYTQKGGYEYFFKTKISDISSRENFVMDVPGNDTVASFKDYMCFHNYSKNNQALVKLLFSEENRKAFMNVGFKGNPNLGSVVMNTLNKSEDFRKFSNDFKADDGVFIIGSLFGGTGASGIPLLVRKIRQSSNDYLKNSTHIGLLAVMPYFEAEPFNKDESEGKLDTSTFFQKTNAALDYYKDHLDQTPSGTPYVNHHYYIGDPIKHKYPNSDGGKDQRNPACFAEFVSALSLFHFADKSSEAVGNITMYHEYGLNNDKQENNGPMEIDFSMKEGKFIKKSMTKFLLLANFAEQYMPVVKDKPWCKQNDQFAKNDKIKEIEKFLKGYKAWLQELACENTENPQNNGRKFNPFDLNTDENQVFEIVKAITPEKHGWFSGKNYVLFDKELNKVSAKMSNDDFKAHVDSWFINLFSEATEELYKSELKEK